MVLETDSPINLGNSGYGSNNGFDGGWWTIILFALIFGWGRNGYGGYGYGSGQGGVGENYVLATDFANLERKIDGVNNGLCDGFYAMNTGMLNGFNGIQQAMCQGFSGVNTAIITQGYETRLGVNEIQHQLSDCCCNLQRSIDGVSYNMAKNTCDIIQAGHNDTQRIVDLLTAQTIELKNERIAEQQAQIQALQLKASQEAQNAYLINELKGCPKPAYVVPNPNCCYNFGNFGFGNCNCNGQTI